ncbi:RNA-directed DNA polymerase from mobile element jockey-like protein [Plakobranchus ocellatus]|uniref:RNA-directed DNA polymerase from mobile element jockey-like protein n=1 Tax=Plakobranchus ocellatus TaxID=259542 RepID=A0AAV3YQW6_9GAST|nr:RNA-directed DNA polymerase from mobile element jockey-like protein [Plakobranchus ocellatus]
MGTRTGVGQQFHMGMYRVVSSQHGDVRLSSPPSGQGAGGGARTRDRRVPADLRADLQATEPPTPHQAEAEEQC